MHTATGCPLSEEVPYSYCIFLVLVCWLVVLRAIQLGLQLPWSRMLNPDQAITLTTAASSPVTSRHNRRQGTDVHPNPAARVNGRSTGQSQGGQEMAGGKRPVPQMSGNPGNRRHGPESKGNGTGTGPVALGDAGGQSPVTTPPEVCHIGFLKVYKAGSSTIQNLLFRFALRRNLTLLLPKGDNIFSYTKNSHNAVLPIPKGSHYDILACHSVFDQQVYSKYLPGDSKFIGIVREPLQLMISAAFYYRNVYPRIFKYLSRIPEQSLITNLIRDPEQFDSAPFSKTKDSMSYDFGFSRTTNDTEISNYLHYLNESFSLVLVLEQFEESLVMLKRLFHWQLSDILYLVGNQFGHLSVSLTDDDIRLFSKRNHLDVTLYNFFREELQRKITVAGRDFKQEVYHFKAVLKNVSEFCRNTKGHFLDIPGSPWNESFTVSNEDCKFMKTPEIQFIQHLRLRHTRNF